MTSLKHQYANEIAEAMAQSLDNKEFTNIFKTAALEKEAGSAFDAFKADVDLEVENRKRNGAPNDYEQIYTKHLPALEQEENAEPGTITKAREYLAQAAKTPGARQPGMGMPPVQQADDVCNCVEQADVEICPVCGKKVVYDKKESVAAKFTIEQLSKLANVLDRRGFNKIANLIDETMQKIARKR